MAWLLLSAGIALDLCCTTCMKLSKGLTQLIPTILTFVFIGASLTVFMLVLKRFNLSFAYPLYAGIGVLCVALIGFLYFKEPVTALKVVSILLIVGGVIGLNWGPAS